MNIQFPFNSDLEKIFSLLNYNCRLVGGCVRDFLLFSKLVEDVDIATPYLPDEVINLLSADFSIIPTGLDHGTITIIGEKKYEITTLRKDEQTDGRHAVVSFDASYEEDAARRDFTMNALYCDYNSVVYDYFDGLMDLRNGIIKFIGDPELRIKEDFLRILRFFRFSTRFGNIDNRGLRACYKLKDGLLKISKERITQEWFKIISAPFFSHFFDDFKPIMDVLLLFFDSFKPECFSLSALGFTSLFFTSKSLLCLSNAQKKYINLLKNTNFSNQAEASIVFNKLGEEFFNDKCILEGVSYKKIKVPELPVNGQDLMSLGYVGKDVGDALKKLEFVWYEKNGEILKSDLLAQLTGL